jgi:hypothetical protein
MKITQTRLKQIIQEELAAVQEAAGDGSGTGVSKTKRDEQRLKAARACNSKKGKQWDPKELTGPGLFSDKLERACKDKVKEELAAVAEAENSWQAGARALRGEPLSRSYEGKVITPSSVTGEMWNMAAKISALGEDFHTDSKALSAWIGAFMEKHKVFKEDELEEASLKEYGDYEGPKSAATTSPRYGQPKPCPEGEIADVDPGGRRRCVDKNYRRPGFFEE